METTLDAPVPPIVSSVVAPASAVKLVLPVVMLVVNVGDADITTLPVPVIALLTSPLLPSEKTACDAVSDERIGCAVRVATPVSVVVFVTVSAGATSVVPLNVNPLVVVQAVEPAFACRIRLPTPVNVESLANPASINANSERMTEESPAELVDGAPDTV